MHPRKKPRVTAKPKPKPKPKPKKNKLPQQKFVDEARQQSVVIAASKDDQRVLRRIEQEMDTTGRK